MKIPLQKQTISLLLIYLVAINVCAQYNETVASDAFTVNLQNDYKVDGLGMGDDSPALQRAIDKVHKNGGGWVVIPKGTYQFSKVTMKSDVHLKISAAATIKPYITSESRKSIVLFVFGDGPATIKNTSIRGDGGMFTVELPPYKKGIKMAMVVNCENFLIENFKVNDQLTKHSSISLNPYLDDPKAYAMPSQGTIRNGAITNALYGYGLIQVQAGKKIHFENIFSEGGVALRLETGWKLMNDLQYGGVWDITGKDIGCKDGKAAVMMGPHSMHNGIVNIENVRSEGCTFAAMASNGFLSSKQKNPNLEVGTFAKGSSIKNVHAVFGTNAQLKEKDVLYVPEENLKHLKEKTESKGLRVRRGPSITAVLLRTDRVAVEEVSYEGFIAHPEVIDASAKFRKNYDE